MTSTSSKPDEKFREAAVQLLKYCRDREWAGWDPYDALNSRLFQSSPFSSFRVCRLALTQFLKRSPINIRALIGITPGQNPKGVALFASAALKLKAAGLCDADLPGKLIGRLMELTSKGQHVSWGYNFAWQQRFILVPAYTPNIICTSFGGNALLDYYEAAGGEKHLDAAASAAQFLMHGLPITWSGDSACISYTPLAPSTVHNASLLGAAFMARLYRHRPDPELKRIAMAAARYSIEKQRGDGAWPYGESPTQQWIDGFHTGYNLCALKVIHRMCPEPWIADSMRKGFAFYRANFFENDCIPKYFHNSTYPIDVHSIAQSIITLLEFPEMDPGGRDLAGRIAAWALANFRSPDGSFHYQHGKIYSNKISYMRWSQAWMLQALSSILVSKSN